MKNSLGDEITKKYEYYAKIFTSPSFSTAICKSSFFIHLAELRD